MLLFTKTGAISNTKEPIRRTLAPILSHQQHLCNKNSKYNSYKETSHLGFRRYKFQRNLINKSKCLNTLKTVDEKTFSVEDARSLVETAMLAAIGGLAYLVSSILKFDTMLSYILPLPIILASLRTGYAAGWSVMTATMFLLVVLMGPLRAISYVLLHGLMAATLGSLWRRGCNFWLTLFTVGAVRMIGQLTYVGLSSAVMRENFFSFILSNVYAMLDQVAVVINIGGTPSPLVVVIVMLNLTLVNNVTFCFVLQVAYRAFLSRMGYDVGKFPAYIQQVIFGSKGEDATVLEPDSSHTNGGSGSRFISSIANFLATPITGSSSTTPSSNPSSRNSSALPSAGEAPTATSTPEAA